MAELSGKFRHEAITKGDYPAVGDWVYIKKIEDEESDYSSYFPAKKFFLKTRGWNKNRRTDYSSKCRLFILVNALNHDFNVRRMERYLLLAYESGAMPVIVLTKSSICNDVEQKL